MGRSRLHSQNLSDRQQHYTHEDGYAHVAAVFEDVAAKHAQLLQAGYITLPIKKFKAGDHAFSSSKTLTATRSKC
jgi:hypothetical protein